MTTYTRNTVVVTVLNLIGLCLTFLVSVIIIREYGANYYMDCYVAAITIPNYIAIVVGGALSYTFIPIFTKKDEKSKQWDLVNNIISIFIVTLGTVVFLGICFAPQIMRVIAPGFQASQILFSSDLLRFYFPIILLTCLNELLASIFYSKNIFLTPLLNKLISPVIMILFIVIIGDKLNVKALIYAGLVSAFFQLTLLFFTLIKRENFKFKFILKIEDKDVFLLLRLLVPLILSSLVYKMFPLIDSFFLSNLHDGSISRINYANKIQTVIGSLISSVFSIQAFTLLSKYSAENDFGEIKHRISFFIRTLLFVSIPIAVIILFFGDNIVRVLFERGSFNALDTSNVAYYLKIYALALPAISIGSIISQGLYVIPDTKSVMIVGFFETCFYIIICNLVFQRYTAATIPIAFALNFNLSVITLAIILRKRLKHKGGFGILLSVFKILILSISIGVLLNFVVKCIDLSDYWILFLCAVTLLSYFFIAYLLKFQEVKFIYEKISKSKNKN